MCAGGVGSAMREPCAEPVTGGDDEYRHAKEAGSNPGGREKGGRGGGQTRAERRKQEPTRRETRTNQRRAQSQERRHQMGRREAERGSHRRQITWNRFSQTRTKRQKPQQSHTRTRSRRDRTESCKGSKSRWCMRHQAALQVGLRTARQGGVQGRTDSRCFLVSNEKTNCELWP